MFVYEADDNAFGSASLTPRELPWWIEMLGMRGLRKLLIIYENAIVMLSTDTESWLSIVSTSGLVTTCTLQDGRFPERQTSDI